MSCGSETAASCAECPVASGDTWCRGDCQLQRGTCKARRDLGGSRLPSPHRSPAVSGSWMSWSSWGACSHLDGQQRQTRNCSHPLGRSCTGSEEKSKDCAGKKQPPDCLRCLRQLLEGGVIGGDGTPATRMASLSRGAIGDCSLMNNY